MNRLAYQAKIQAHTVLIQQLLRWQLCYMPINVKSIQT